MPLLVHSATVPAGHRDDHACLRPCADCRDTTVVARLAVEHDAMHLHMLARPDSNTEEEPRHGILAWHPFRFHEPHALSNATALRTHTHARTHTHIHSQPPGSLPSHFPPARPVRKVQAHPPAQSPAPSRPSRAWPRLAASSQYLRQSYIRCPTAKALRADSCQVGPSPLES